MTDHDHVDERDAAEHPGEPRDPDPAAEAPASRRENADRPTGERTGEDEDRPEGEPDPALPGIAGGDEPPAAS